MRAPNFGSSSLSLVCCPYTPAENNNIGAISNYVDIVAIPPTRHELFQHKSSNPVWAAPTWVLNHHKTSSCVGLSHSNISCLNPMDFYIHQSGINHSLLSRQVNLCPWFLLWKVGWVCHLEKKWVTLFFVKKQVAKKQVIVIQKRRGSLVSSLFE